MYAPIVRLSVFDAEIVAVAAVPCSRIFRTGSKADVGGRAPPEDVPTNWIPTVDLTWAHVRACQVAVPRPSAVTPRFWLRESEDDGTNVGA